MTSKSDTWHTWPSCTEGAPVGGRGELLLAGLVLFQVFLSDLQNILELLCGVLEPQPQVVHNGM